MTVTANPVALGPQLAQVKEELLLNRERLRRICQGLDGAAWTARPVAGRWSVGDIVTHLNLTSEQYIPLLDEAIRDGRARGLEGHPPYSKGLVGWALARYLEPPYTVRTKSVPAFEPRRVDPMPETLERFDYLQQELQARIDRSAGLALDRLRMASPFDRRVKYNLYAAFCILAAHQRRHLWQAEQLLQQTAR